jgi:two-component system, OmpR family, phosphate regulon sensor histidine kinase PhoR
MEWPLFIILFALAGAWLLRERTRARDEARLASALDALAHGRAPVAVPARFSGRIAKATAEQNHFRRQRELAEANLHILLSSMADGVMVVDSRHTIRLVNQSLRRTFALDENIIGHPALEALREPLVDEMISAALAAGATQENEIELAGRKPAVVLVVSVTPMRDAAGEPGALGIFRDITRLTQLEQVRRQFVANVSHELRTPLAIFQGYVENLVDNPGMSADERMNAFAILEKHSKRLNALVEDLLILARLEADSEELEAEPLDVAGLLDGVARDWSLRIGKKNVHLNVNCQPSLPALHADRFRLEQVFNNLLDNALKYTPAGHAITLSAARDGDFVTLAVADTGAGILSADLPHIFERFYRADKARSRELGGTGLGLSIVKHIAQSHGGTVSAESTFGKGTTIRVRLPFAAAVRPE